MVGIGRGTDGHALELAKLANKPIIVALSNAAVVILMDIKIP
jgi:hypothetical protein